MKKILHLFIVLVLLSCKSTKTNNTEALDWINAQKFTVIKPNNWRAIKHHGYVGYTPLKKVDNFFNNIVSVFQYQLKEKSDFKEFVESQINLANKAMKITSQEVLAEEGQFDDVYIHKFKSTWNGENYKVFTIYFDYNGDFYYYNYSSLEHNYDKYYDDAISIYQSIEFKF